MAGTTHTLFHPDNDSLRILFPNYRCEQERVEMRNNLKKTIQFLSELEFKAKFLRLLSSHFWLFLAYYKWRGHQCHKDEMHWILMGQSEKDVHFFMPFICHPCRWTRGNRRPIWIIPCLTKEWYYLRGADRLMKFPLVEVAQKKLPACYLRACY